MDAITPSRRDAGRRVLVAHSAADVRRAVISLLEGAGHPVAVAADPRAALASIAERPPDLVLAEAALRDGHGRSLVLAAHDALDGAVPVIALVDRADADVVLTAVGDGADDHLVVPPDPADLLMRVRACLHPGRRRAASEQAALRRIAVAVASEASEREVLDLVARQLALVHGVAGGAVVRFDDGEAAFVGRWSQRPGAWPPRELTVPLTSPLPTPVPRADDFRAFAGALPWILDAEVFRGSVAAPVRVHDRLWGAVLVATGEAERLPPDTEARLAAFADLVALAIGNAEARAELSRRAATDPLTGLLNRGVFEERLAEEVARSRRHGRELALALLDLDGFKAVNDIHGHMTGDAVLRETAARLGARAREGDVLARVGGEEFAWLMPETDGMEAWQAMERARAALAGAPFPEVGRVTISAGVCGLAQADGGPSLYRQADAALYWAKHHGRDVVFLYTAEAMGALGEEARAAELRRGQAFQSLRVLARAVDAKDASTRRHSERVAGLAIGLAELLGWSSGRRAQLHEAALVHDVGKVAVPDDILFKPERLSPVEMSKISMHAALGAEMLSDLLTPEQAAWVRAHHERWDGGGYPQGLAGEAIPDGARIIHLADAWDVMTSARPYVTRLTDAQALAECRANAGTQFWPLAVAALESLWAAGGIDAEVLERAKVETV
jgi:diguanylate cyclase (GGDEF)-like protein